MSGVDLLKERNLSQEFLTLNEVFVMSPSLDDVHRLLLVDVEKVAPLHRGCSRSLLVQLGEVLGVQISHLLLRVVPSLVEHARPFRVN